MALLETTTTLIQSLPPAGHGLAHAVIEKLQDQQIADNGFGGVLSNPRLYLLLLVGVLIAQAINAQEAPGPNSGPFYRWWWRFSTGTLNVVRVYFHFTQSPTLPPPPTSIGDGK